MPCCVTVNAVIANQRSTVPGPNHFSDTQEFVFVDPIGNSIAGAT